jgi:hypothetical protein
MPRLSLLSKLVVLAGAVAALALGVTGALASRAEDDLATVETKLADCRKDLAEERRALAGARDLLAKVKKENLVLIGFQGSFALVNLEEAKRLLAVALLTDEITPAKAARLARELARRRRATIPTLTRLITKLDNVLELTNERCAKLAEQRNKLRRGGGGGGSQPARGAFPGGTATSMTFTIAGKSVTTDLKSNRQTDEPTIKAKASTTLDGSVKLNGTLPSGWTVVVFHNGGGDIRLNSADGGDFTVQALHANFDAVTRPGAYVCSTKVPPICSQPAAQANLTIDWDV